MGNDIGDFFKRNGCGKRQLYRYLRREVVEHLRNGRMDLDYAREILAENVHLDQNNVGPEDYQFTEHIGRVFLVESVSRNLEKVGGVKLYKVGKTGVAMSTPNGRFYGNDGKTLRRM